MCYRLSGNTESINLECNYFFDISLLFVTVITVTNSITNSQSNKHKALLIHLVTVLIVTNLLFVMVITVTNSITNG